MKSIRYAALLALGYVLVAGLYIGISGRLAARIARSVEELERIEHLKGYAFVVLTGLVLFGLSAFFFSHLTRLQEETAKGRQALMLVRSKAYAAELAAAVAHDFNNLMMVLRAGLDELAEPTEQARHMNSIEEMSRALDSAKNLTEKLVRSARGERATRRERRSVATVAIDTVRLIRKLPRVTGRVFDVRTPSMAIAMVDPVMIEQVIVNLVLNAADACGAGGHISLEVGEDEESLWLRVGDDGPGFAQSDAQSAFEPFHSTKGGMGLGLLSVRACAEALHGKLTVGKSVLGGASFEVRWPKDVPG